MRTPGHTPEHISYVVADTSRADEPVLIFTGGDLLVGSVGRPDLLGRELSEKLAPQLYDSLFGKILKLEDYVEVMPTHGAGSLCGRSISSKRTTTIGYERRNNVFLQKTDRQEFVDFVLDGNPYVPAYYKDMRPGNLDGATGFAAPDPRPLSVGDVQHALGHGAQVIDTRSAGAYGGGHLPGAYSVGLGSMLATWVGSLLPVDVPIILVLERASDWDAVVTALGRVGYERIMGYLSGGIESWQEAGLPVARVEQIDVQELDHRRQETPDLQIVDVRMEGEWQSGHIPGATFVPLTDLPDMIGGIDRDRPTVVICGSGYRSSIASAFLERRGVRTLANTVGGMTAWNAAGLPTTTETTTEMATASVTAG
jgi:hydroxyacylglutathione hydrolase